MRDEVTSLIDHYATVTDGSRALHREAFDSLCVQLSLTPGELCYAIAREVAERFVAGRIDFDGGDFALNDLFWASGCSLNGLALEIFYAFEDGEVMDPRHPPGTVPWKELTLPRVLEALKADDESRTINSVPPA